MKKTIFALSITAILSGCTATIKESNFIEQSEKVSDYSQTLLATLDESTPNHIVKPIKITPSNGTVVLNGLHLDAPHTNNTILYIPGNGMSVERAAKKALVDLSQYGYDIVIFDRRGLGASNGTATIAHLISDANASFDFTKNQLKADTIIVHGFSLGSFVAAQVAKSKPIDGLVLQGSATNVEGWIDEAMPWYAKMFFNLEVDDAFYTVDNQAVLKTHYDGPLLIVAGGKDVQTPETLSHQLFNASQSKDKSLVIAKEADHNQMFSYDNVQLAYKNFVSKL